MTLEPRERVLAVGSGAVATLTALHLPGIGRLPYQKIEYATWNDGVLTVREVGGARHRVELTEPGSVPETVRERVTATVVVNHHTKLAAGGVRIIGRRPLQADTIDWSFVFDKGLDPDDPGIQAQAEQALEDVRRQLGV